MKSHSSLIKILLSNTWQENFNTWQFHESVILIKKYSRPAKLVPYSIEETEGQIVLKTGIENFGDLVLELKDDALLPKIVVRSRINLNRQLVLEAFIGFSKEQKLVIETQMTKLKDIFYAKRNEIKETILDGKNKQSGQTKSLAEYEDSFEQIARKISLLETVITSTIDIASNFGRYHECFLSDIKKLFEDIERI
jgi:hypothetical protein